MFRKLNFIILGLLLIVSSSFASKSITIKVYSTNKAHQYLGTVIAKDTTYGLLLVPNLKGLKEGVHGFHLHLYPSCAHNGKSAGGHLDPKKTNKHLGPYDAHGHLGDLPVLYVNRHGLADIPELAPKLSVAQIRGHSLMIHAGGDSYSDHPKPLGGGSARVACGVIK